MGVPDTVPKRIERKAFILLNEAKYRSATQVSYLVNRYLRGCRVEKPPVFIVGPGHSGTSLLLAVLGAHSNLFAIPFETAFAFKPAPAQQKLLRRFRKMAVAHRKSRWVEKTPRHVRKIGELVNMFPDARIVVIIRDGRDVACSYKARRGAGIGKHVERWVTAIEHARDHWDHPQVHVLRYEDLVVDFSGTTRKLMAFVGETYESRQAEYYKKPIRFFWHNAKKPEDSRGGNHEQYRNWQVNQPLFDGRGRWHEEMKPQEKEVFKQCAGELLIALGYEVNNDW